MRLVWLAWGGLLLVLPVAGAQQPVTTCQRECEPHAPDVNGPGVNERGPVRVVLYTHLLDFNTGSMSVFRPQHVPPTSSVILSGGQPGCVSASWSMVALPPELREGRTWYTPAELVEPLLLRPFGNVLYAYVQPFVAMAPATALNVQMDVRIGPGPRPSTYPALASGTASALVMAPAMGNQVIEFRVPLEIQRTVWPAELIHEGFHASIQLCQTAGTASIGDWRFVNRPSLHNRLILNLEQAIRVDPLDVQEDNGTLYVGADVWPALGRTDLAVEGIRLLVSPASRDGEEGSLLQATRGRRSTGHGEPALPVRAQWILDAEQFVGRRPWTFTVAASNHQGTASAEASAEWLVPEFSGRSVPDVGVGLWLVLLAAMRLRRSGPARRAR